MTLALTEVLADDGPHDATLTLPFDARQKSRLLTQLDTGEAAGLFLPRGTVLRGGDRLRAADGRVVRVRAAREQVSTVGTPGSLLLVRAAYHLGNRHVPLQIGIGWLRYQCDHVLDAMVAGFGLEVAHEEAPFEPESGAYGGGHHHAGDTVAATGRPAPSLVPLISAV